MLQNSHDGEEHAGLDGKCQDDIDSSPGYTCNAEVDRTMNIYRNVSVAWSSIAKRQPEKAHLFLLKASFSSSRISPRFLSCQETEQDTNVRLRVGGHSNNS